MAKLIVPHFRSTNNYYILITVGVDTQITTERRKNVAELTKAKQERIDSFVKLEKLLTKNNITMYQLAKDLDFPQSTLSDWKYGRSKPKVDKLTMIADYFGVDVQYFI